MINCFRYANGTYTPAEIDEEVLKKKYHLSQNVGEDSGLHYALQESDDGWCVSFSTAGRYCDILCDTWPDLIGILAVLSPIALAALINEETSEAIMLLLRPSIDEVERRRRRNRNPKLS
jgi:hypothetical protein